MGKWFMLPLVGCCIAIALIIAAVRRVAGRDPADAGFAPPARWPATPRVHTATPTPRTGDPLARALIAAGAAWLVLSLFAMHVLGVVELAGLADVVFHGTGTVLMAIGAARMLRAPEVLVDGR